MGKYLGMCDELVIVSKCTYGCYSPFIKNVLDRSISYISPYFTMRNNEMHHEHRYENKIQITAYFYDTKISENEKKTAMDLVHANALNFDASVKDVFFYKTSDEIKAVIK